MRRGVACWLGVLCLVPGIARAGEVTLGGEMRAGYDSNVFSRDGQAEVDSGVIVLRGIGRVEDELERGSYSLWYRPSFFYNEAKQADNFWNQRATARGQYFFSPRTQVTVSEDFAWLEKIVFSPDEQQNPNFDDGVRRTTFNSLRLDGSHLLTKRLAFFGGSNYDIYRFNRKTDEDSDNIAGNAGLRYALSSQLTVGAGGRFSYRGFDPRVNNFRTTNPLDPPSDRICGGQDAPGTRTRTYSGFVLADYQFDENTSANLQAGPAFIENSQFVCSDYATANGVWRREETNQTTWFAALELIRRWKRIDVSLGYTRQDGIGQGGTSSINDFLTGRVTWKIQRFWTANLAASWVRREQDNARNAAINKNETMLYSIVGRSSYQLAEHLRAFVELSYRDQTQRVRPSGIIDENNFDAVRAFAGIRYELDPLRY